MNRDFEDRKRAIEEMAYQLGDRSFSNVLTEAYMRDTGYLRRDVFSREIEFPIFLLNYISKETVYTRSYDLDFQRLQPLGKVAVLLPKNGINLLISKAVCSSFLAGNETLVKIPGLLRQSAGYFRQLVLNHLPDVKFESDEKSSAEFLRECIASKEIDAVVIYGDDRWVWSYRDAVRRSGTKLIFEGPGKDPQVIMADADLDMAVSDAVACCMLNGGQSCSAIERIFVHASIAEDFIARLARKLSLLRIGNPEDEGADIGPIYSRNVLNRLVEQLKDAVENGATVICGGYVVQVAGTDQYALQATIVSNCRKEMKIFQEENFGPVFPIITFSSEEELLEDLEVSNYGLNASIYGSCSEAVGNYLNRSHRNVYFNSTVTSSCNGESRILDGGYKNSGFVWEWKGTDFLHREGRRMLLKELSM